MRQGRVMPETAEGGMGVTFWEKPTDKEGTLEGRSWGTAVITQKRLLSSHREQDRRNQVRDCSKDE